MDDDEVFAACARLRRELADWLETLTADQLGTPSLCEKWTVRDVSAHLTRVLTLSNAGLLVSVLRWGGNLHRANAEVAREEGRLPLAVQLQHLRDHADTRLKPPMVGVLGPLTDLLVHTGDMRLSLGLPLCPDPQLAATALDFLRSNPPGFVPKSRLKGLKLSATDSEQSWGEGTEIRGRMADLIMAACGRAVVLPQLSGPGRDILAARLRKSS
jgi:uncharacterized protein (TIGR03083 family)